MLLQLVTVGVALATLSAADAQATGENAIVTSPPAAAEHTSNSNIENAGFFSRGSVNDFTKNLDGTERKDFEYYLPEPKKLSLKDDETFEAPKGSADAQVKTEQLTAPKTPQDIVSMYGDPNADATVKAVNDAPAPYKGLLAAIDQGRDDLALQYARQWVMYNKKLDKVTKLAVGMAGVVQEKEGMVPQGSFPSAEKSQISPEALKAYDDNLDKMSADKNIEINEKAKKILDQVSLALNEDGKGVPAPVAPAAPTAQQMLDIKRTRFAAHLAETYLYVPQGQLDVLVFFRPQDSAAQTIGKDFEKLYQRTREFQNLQFKAFTPDSLTLRDAEAFKKASAATFPLVQGESLAAELNVKTFPTIVFVSRQSGEAVVEKEFLEYEFVEQMLRKFGVMG